MQNKAGDIIGGESRVKYLIIAVSGLTAMGGIYEVVESRTIFQQIQGSISLIVACLLGIIYQLMKLNERKGEIK